MASLGGILYMYTRGDEVKTPEQTVKEEVANTIIAVGKLMVLPVGEEPSVASVTDPDKLRDQAFFANAKVGDKVLIYQKSGKAILYSPTLNKIIEVSPVNIGGQTEQNLPQGQESTTSNTPVRNNL